MTCRHDEHHCKSLRCNMMQVLVKLWSGWPPGCSHNGRMLGRNGYFRRWLCEEHGQDLIEYALLCSAIGFAGAVAFSFISTAMNTTYASWDTAVQTEELVEIPDPVPTP